MSFKKIRISLFTVLLIFFFSTTNIYRARAQITQHKACGDRICNEIEKQTGGCPVDCGNTKSNFLQPQNISIQDERQYLPQVTIVEKWQLIKTISTPGHFAPSLVSLKNGSYRIYWNDFIQKGIASAVSKDGLNWTDEPGLRLKNGKQGDLDCVASHPWVMPMGEGFRMYYQGDAKRCDGNGDMSGGEPQFRIMSAFSRDGVNFTREGVRIDIGDKTGLSQAAHGRMIKMSDNNYRLYFSANLKNQPGPPPILSASSDDGLHFVIDAKPVIEKAHDPTVVRISDSIFIYATYLKNNFLLLKSTDGKIFVPQAWIEFYDQSGKRIEHVGDPDVILKPDGTVWLYASGKGLQGLGVFKKK